MLLLGETSKIHPPKPAPGSTSFKPKDMGKDCFPRQLRKIIDFLCRNM